MPHPALTNASLADRPALGGWVTTLSPTAVLAFAGTGYAYVGIDTQHALLDDHEAAALLQPLIGSNVASIVRVNRNDPGQINKVLDAGADGVIVPLVNSAEEARQAVGPSLFPPRGNRSYGPIRAELGHEVASLEARASVFVQIESKEAVQEAAEICATPGVAGVYVGPGDLAISYGKSPLAAFQDPPDSQIGGIIEWVASVAQEAGVIPGIHAGSGQMAAYWGARGYRLMSLSDDSEILTAGATLELQAAQGLGPGVHAGAPAGPYGGVGMTDVNVGAGA
jgi:2-keto-3-deoxy-L-rhamnonate aldolase RhmA